MTTPIGRGASRQYDPSGAQDPHSPFCTVQGNSPQADGSYLYEITLLQVVNYRRVAIRPNLLNVAETSLFLTPPTPGPGNDL